MNVIEIKNLSFTYPGSSERVLDEVNLQIKKGDFLAILGNNGSGKSTLCKAINGLIPTFINGEIQGEVWVNGRNTQDLDIGILAKEVAYVYQDFENQIVRPIVLDDASYACMNYGFEEYEKMGRNALEICGLKNKIHDYIWQLSGGQTHLLALAGALALGPDILILDEPIAQLDPNHADMIYKVLRDLNENFGKTIITIEHHTEYIANFCSHVLLMKKGKISWQLPTKEALVRVEDLESSSIFPPQVTQAAYKLKEKYEARENKTLPINLDEAKTYFSSLKYSPSLQEKSVPEKKEPILSFQETQVSYEQIKGQEHKVFKGLNLDIHKGEKIALIGSNGAGKSTLLKLLIGLVQPSAGKLFIQNKDSKNYRIEEISQSISMIYQNPEEMFIMDSIEEDIAYAMKVRQVENYQERTQDLLKQFNLLELKDRDGRLLSGGQMRKASVAIGIALHPKILLLDEPTANLDMATRKEIIRVLDDIKSHTETVIIATHDMQLVAQWAERIVVLHQGKIIGDGNREVIFDNKDLTQLVGIRPPEIFTLGKELDKESFTYTVEDFLKDFGVSHG